MPLYEYRCPTCDRVFEQRRSMAQADADVRCPAGHTGVRRLLSVFASTGSAAPSPGPVAAPVRGCGGGCACH